MLSTFVTVEHEVLRSTVDAHAKCQSDTDAMVYMYVHGAVLIGAMMSLELSGRAVNAVLMVKRL
jgi:hypothetical protein